MVDGISVIESDHRSGGLVAPEELGIVKCTAPNPRAPATLHAREQHHPLMPVDDVARNGR
jgi:hypothetical protein